MDHGYTQIGIARHGQKMEIQAWPNLIDGPGLLMVSGKHGAQSWSVEYHKDGFYERVIIEVESVEITYRGVGTQNMLALEMVQGISPAGSYFDKKDYPAHDYINGQVLEQSPVEDYSVLANQLRRAMPGLNIPVTCPCDCESWHVETVWTIIQHLNDTHHPNAGVGDRWSRERIADWTEGLPIDLTIDPSAAEKREAAWAHAQEQQEFIEKWISEPAIVDQKFLDELTGTAKGKEEA